MEDNEKFYGCYEKPAKRRNCCCCLKTVVCILLILFAVAFGILFESIFRIIAALTIGAFIVLLITLGIMAIVGLILYLCCCKPRC